MFDNLFPVSTADRYFPRPEFVKLIQGVNADVPQCLALVGIPGAGKSSMLRTARGVLDGPLTSCYVGLGELETVDDDTFSRAISYALNSQSSLDKAIASATSSGRRVALFIDDFDRIAERISGDLLSRIRALVTGRFLGKIALVTASTRPLYELCEAVRGSNLYNIFRSVPVSALPDAEFMKWADANLGFSDEFWRLSGGFPALIARLRIEGWTPPEDIPLGVFDGVAAMLSGLVSEEMAILKECALSDDPYDVITMAPRAAAAYLVQTGLLDKNGGLTSDLIKMSLRATRADIESAKLSLHTTIYLQVRRLELSLRSLIRGAMTDKRIPSNAFSVVLNEAQYDSLQRRKARFRFSKPDDCDASHFPEAALVIKKYYPAFATSLNLKKQDFDRNYEIIAPIRNEEFHFHAVPEVELKRAEVALYDVTKSIG